MKNIFLTNCLFSFLISSYNATNITQILKIFFNKHNVKIENMKTPLSRTAKLMTLHTINLHCDLSDCLLNIPNLSPASYFLPINHGLTTANLPELIKPLQYTICSVVN